LKEKLHKVIVNISMQNQTKITATSNELHGKSKVISQKSGILLPLNVADSKHRHYGIKSARREFGPAGSQIRKLMHDQSALVISSPDQVELSDALVKLVSLANRVFAIANIPLKLVDQTNQKTDNNFRCRECGVDKR
jgi:hypothetical protein